MSIACKQCETENIDGAKFCTSCGANIAEDKNSQNKQKMSDKALGYRIILGVVIVIGVVAGLSYYAYNKRPSVYIDGDLAEENTGIMIETGTRHLANGTLYSRHENYTSETPYKDGRKDGVAVTYYDSFQLKSVISYKDGEKNGIAKMYLKSGQLSHRSHYKDGLLHGADIDYFKNGQIHWTKSYVDGLETGISTIFDQTGLPSEVDIYQNGALISARLYYGKSGKSSDVTGTANLINIYDARNRAIAEDNEK